MNNYTYSQIEVGLEESFEYVVTTEREDAFRDMTGDENPLHRDNEFACGIGNGRFNSHVSFGMLTASLCSTLAGVYLPGEYSLIHSIDELSFLKPVYAGDRLVVTGVVIDKIDGLDLIIIKIGIKNQNSKTVMKAKMKVLVLK